MLQRKIAMYLFMHNYAPAANCCRRGLIASLNNSPNLLLQSDTELGFNVFTINDRKNSCLSNHIRRQSASLFLFVIAKITRKPSHLFVEGIKFEASFGNEKGVIEAVGLEEQVHVVENSFGAPGAEREGLQAGEVGFFQQALEFLVGFRPIFGRALRAKAPQINAGDGAAEFGK
jgi:hypothetical protein